MEPTTIVVYPVSFNALSPQHCCGVLNPRSKHYRARFYHKIVLDLKWFQLYYIQTSRPPQRGVIRSGSNGCYLSMNIDLFSIWNSVLNLGSKHYRGVFNGGVFWCPTLRVHRFTECSGVEQARWRRLAPLWNTPCEDVTQSRTAE